MKYHADHEYLSLLEEVLTHGVRREDRTGVGTIGIFGAQRRYDLTQGFPLLTTKRIPTKAMVGELLWFLSGSTNVRELQENNITIWDEWADPQGNLGPVYGAQWRNFGGPSSLPSSLRLTSLREEDGEWYPVQRGVDQIAEVMKSLRDTPFSRRHIVTAWNPLAVPEQALPPCHSFFQFHVDPDPAGNPARLNCQLYQRSADLFLGVPFNIASYSLLTAMMAQELGLQAGTFVHSFGDAHIYLNHLEQVKEQLSRRDQAPPMPRLSLAAGKSVLGTGPSAAPGREPYTLEDVVFEGYSPLPTIKAEVAV